MASLNWTSRVNSRIVVGFFDHAKIASSSLSSCRPSLNFRFSAPESPLSLPRPQSFSPLSTSSSSRLFQPFSDKTTEASAEGQKGESAQPPPADAAVGKEELEKLERQAAEQKEKEEQILDKYRRAIAENDNMRKRLTKQIEDAKVFGIQGFCKDLLDVADVLSRAVEAGEKMREDGSEAAAADAAADMVEGVKLTQTQLLQVFGRHGLVQIAPVAGEDKFDPNFHEAMFQVPAPVGVEENVVLDVQKIGYALHGRTIRPALVGVSKK